MLLPCPTLASCLKDGHLDRTQHRELGHSYQGMEQRGWRGFRATPAAQEDIKIEVPQMGDSISEGSVANLGFKVGKHSAVNIKTS